MIDLDRRLFLAGAAGTALATNIPMAAAETTEPAKLPVNPLVYRRADAQVFRHDDGQYYLTGSVPEYDRLVLRRSKTLAGLSGAEERVLWRHQASGPLSGFIWAPELHQIDGRWVMYFAAGPSGGGEDVFRIRTWAIVCDGPDPMTGNWSVLGQFETPWDGFNLDSTIFAHKGINYFVWAQREPGIDTNSNLYMAPLKTPLTLGAKAVRLTVPTLDWEVLGFKVAEAPAILHRNGRLFMTYSASATDARYCLGMLTADENADIMDPKAWTKSPQPVFVTSRATDVYGPGHNSFTVDEEGRDVLIYHGRDYEAIVGDPLFDPNRHTRMQRIYYRADGTPDFGIPVGNGPVPDRISPAGDAKAFVHHDGLRVGVGAPASLPQSQFRRVPGRFGTGSVALEPIDLPGYRIVTAGKGVVAIAADDGSLDFARRSSFRSTLEGQDMIFAMAHDETLTLQHGGGTMRVAKGKGADALFRLS